MEQHCRTPQLMGRTPGRLVKTRGSPHGHDRHRSMSRSSTPHLMSSGPGRPINAHGPLYWSGEATHLEPVYHGPRPATAYQISRGRAAARPIPLKFLRMSRGLTEPITCSNVHRPARPGPAHRMFKKLDPARPSQSQVSDRSGPVRLVLARTNGLFQALKKRFLPNDLLVFWRAFWTIKRTSSKQVRTGQLRSR